MQIKEMQVNVLNKKINEINIQRDFDIFVFKKNDTYKKNISFAALSNLKECAISNQYYFVHLISKKNSITLNELKELKIEGFEVSKTEPADLTDTSLFNLFFNMYGSRNFICENDTSSVYGEFYYPIIGQNKDKFFRSAMHVRYLSNNGLNMNVTTFKKVKNNHKKNFKQKMYQWDDSSLVPNRIEDSDDAENYWIVGARKDENKNVNFFENANLKKLDDSKVGILNKFINEFNEEFKRYITIGLNNIDEVQQYDIEFNRETFLKRIGRERSFKEINIVDLVKSTQTSENIVKLKSILNDKGIQTTECNTTVPGFNICIIKSEEYFRNHPDQKDTHQESCGEVIVQNVTDDNFKMPTRKNSDGEMSLFEENQVDFKWENNNLLLKVLQELLSKKSIVDERIDKGLLSGSNIENNLYCLTFPKYDKEKRYTLISKLNKNNDITFNLIKDDIFDSTDPEIKKVVQFLEKFEINSMKQIWKVECIFYDSMENLNLILKTKLYALPNVNKIRDLLKLSNKDRSIEVSRIYNDNYEFKSLLDDKNEIAIFESINKELDSRFDSHYIKLKEYISLLKEYPTIENGRKALYKKYHEYLYRKYKDNVDEGYLPFSNHKQKEFRPSYDSLNGINFCEKIPGIKRDPQKTYYWIGSQNKSIKPSYPKGNPIRVIGTQLINNSGFNTKILKQFFDVDFVRINEATVQPFMVKFNNTYWELNKDKV